MSKKVTRDELIAAFQPYIKQGVQNPFDIFDRDDESRRVSNLDTAYHEAQAEIRKSLSPAEQIRVDVAESTVFFDAGFTDIDLLDEIANDWLVNTLGDADDLQQPELVAEVKAKINEIEIKIKQLDQTYELTVWDD